MTYFLDLELPGAKLMLGALIVWMGLGALGAGDYLRPFGAKVFDQATFDAETFGDKKVLARDKDGLHVTLPISETEAGYKTPQALKIGGDCTITATLDIRKLPKPGGEDGVAIGLAVATQDIDHPEATLLRQVETDGKQVFRFIDKGGDAPEQGQMRRMRPGMMVQIGFGGPDDAKKKVRHTVPAKGNAIRLGVRRQGSTLRYLVFDEIATEPREIGHFELGSTDIVGVKVFVTNRNGTDAVEILLRDLTIHAERISGLGTAVRTIYGTVVHGDPTALEAGALVVGGPPPTPPPAPKPATPTLAPAPVPAATAAPAATPALVPPPAAVDSAVSVTITTEVVTAPAAIAPGDVQIVSGPVTVAVPAPVTAQPKPAEDAKTPAPPEKKLVPLDEVETIAFEKSSVLAARYLGQPNVDSTGRGGKDVAKEQEKTRDADKDKDKEKDKEVAKDKPKPGGVDDLAAPPPGTARAEKVIKVEAKPNGIRDIHLSLSSLRPVVIQRVQIQCPTDKGQATWQLDTTGTDNWPLTITRAGVESWCDLFLEPPDGDCKDKEFAITLSYSDGQQANCKATATGSTDSKLKFDSDSPGHALDARVYLAGDEQLFGKLEAISGENLSLLTPWGDKLDIPMTRVVGVYFGMADHRESPEAFGKRLKTRGDQDTLLARAKDGEVVAINGVVEAINAGKLGFVYGGKTRTLPLKGVEAVVLANRPAPAPPTEVRPTFDLAGGIIVSGKWNTIEATTWQVEAPWGQTIKLPAGEIRSVRIRGGQMTYLSDLEPSQVEEIPYFSRRTPYRKDLTLTGKPLKLDGQIIDKGLAVHARTSLTYDLSKRYTTFETLVGFDETDGKKGRVDCRIFADGKEIYANPDLRADAPAVALNLPVTGVEQLKLLVDFGNDEDTGDRVIWGNARLYRRGPAPKPATPAPATAPLTTPAPASAPTPKPASAP